MRFGICTAFENLSILEKLGYDYLETSAVGLWNMSEQEFAELTQIVAPSKIKVEAMCGLLPGDFPFYAEGNTQLEKYLGVVFQRAEKLGVKVAVFGSGKPRHKPDDLTFAEAVAIFTEKAEIIADTAWKYGITIALEPLNHGETNFINTVTEAAIMAEHVDHDNLGVLADGFHMFTDGESMENIRTVGKIAHGHIAVLKGRGYPTTPDPQVKGFLQALKDIGYQGRLSIEGGTENFAQDAADSLKVLRSFA